MSQLWHVITVVKMRAMQKRTPPANGIDINPIADEHLLLSHDFKVVSVLGGDRVKIGAINVL